MEGTKPTLKNAQAFRRALQDYQVSDHARRVLSQAQIVVMSGVAGGGRNTVINRLVEQHNYYFLVSDTTRPPKMRDGRMEQNGVHYYFRTEEDMLRDIQKGEFVEAEIIHNQQVSGTSIREIERANAQGRVAIHDFEYGGANNVAAAKPDAVIIGLLPPSYDEWIRRFRDREVIHEDEFMNRMHTAEKVLQNMLDKPYFKIVINDDVGRCVDYIRGLVEGAVYTSEAAERGKVVAAAMLDQVERALRAHRLEK